MTNDTPLKLTTDQQVVVQREAKGLNSALGHLFELASKNTLSAEFAQTILQLVEHRVADIGRCLGIATESQESIRQRAEALRTANMRVYELEQQLGEAGSPEQVGLVVKDLNARLSQWWGTVGFGYVSDFKISDGGTLTVTLNVGLSYGSLMRDMSDTPVSDAEAHAQRVADLVARGFKIVERPRREGFVEDCDQTRSTLTQLIKGTFPTAILWDSANHFDRTTGVCELRSVTVVIRNLAEIKVLPRQVDELRAL